MPLKGRAEEKYRMEIMKIQCLPLHPFRREAHLRQNAWFRRDEQGTPIRKDTDLYGKLAQKHDSL